MKYSVILLLVFFASKLKAAERGRHVVDDEIHVKPRLSLHTEGRIVNNTPLDIIDTTVSGIDSFDWEDGKGPAQTSKFANQYIPAYSSLQRRFEVNKPSSNSPYGLTLYFVDGTSVYYKINQQAAIGRCEADLRFDSYIYDITYNTEDNLVLIVTIGFNTPQLEILQAINSANKHLQQKEYEDAENEVETDSLFDQMYSWGTISAELRDELKNTRFASLKSSGLVLYESGLQNIYRDNIQATRNLTAAHVKFQKALRIKSDKEIEDYSGIIDGLLSK